MLFIKTNKNKRGKIMAKMTYNAIVKILDALYREQQMVYTTEKSKETEDYFCLLDEIYYYEQLKEKVAES